jgi:O-succinylbenzoic acid--CoA ligase
MKTNDIVEFDADGIRFRILGRKDNVICSGGIKIQAEEVERIIADHFTLPFMITRKKDEKFGEVVVMVIESTEHSAIDTARKVCQDFLPKYWQPRDYMTVEKLPRTETGKIKR